MKKTNSTNKTNNKVNNTVQSSTSTKQLLFKMTMSNVRSVSRFTGSVEVPLSLCYVDERYQKLRTHKNLKKLEDKWDERKLSPIVIVPHPEDYCFAIVDGQGRYKVATRKGYESLPAIVLLGTEEMIPDERLKFEATYFIGQDTEIEKLRELEKHPAKLIQGDTAAWDIENALNKYGFKVYSASKKSGGVLGSYTHTYQVAKQHGFECLDFIFSIIKEAKWSDEKNGLTHFNVRMLDGIWEYYPKLRSEIHDFLCKELKSTTPSLFLARSRAAYPEREPRIACVLYLQDFICDKMGIKQKQIMFDGKRLCKAG